MPLNFTLHYDDRTNDIDDVAGDVAATPGVGLIYFDVVILPGYRIPMPNYPSRPTGLTMRRFSAYLDTDGRLKKEPGGEIGVRLWANDPDWGLPRLQYRVTAELTDLLGRPIQWRAFFFDAPVADITKYLTDYMPLPGQKFGRGPASYLISGSFDGNGNLLLENDDGSILGPISPPAGVLFIMDNGDGTATVG